MPDSKSLEEDAEPEPEPLELPEDPAAPNPALPEELALTNPELPAAAVAVDSDLELLSHFFCADCCDPDAKDDLEPTEDAPLDQP
jgi:hypothetical protein